MSIEEKWNPRYVSYAIAHGESDPAAMLERDKAAHPHGCMVPFMFWNSDEWNAWYDERGRETRTDPRSEEFTAWQRQRAELAGAALQGKKA